MPGAVNTRKEPTWHNMRLRAFEGYQKHTHTTLTEPTIVAQSGWRLFEAIKFGHEMPGAMNTHRTHMAQHWIARL